MHINADSEEYLDYHRVLAVLQKYCSFMTENIYLHGEDEHKHECECGHDHGEDEECECKHEEKPINDKSPL